MIFVSSVCFVIGRRRRTIAFAYESCKRYKVTRTIVIYQLWQSNKSIRTKYLQIMQIKRKIIYISNELIVFNFISGVLTLFIPDVSTVSQQP